MNLSGCILDHVIVKKEGEIHTLRKRSIDRLQYLFWQTCRTGINNAMEMHHLHTIISGWNILSLSIDVLQYILTYISKPGTKRMHRVAFTCKLFWNIIYDKVYVTDINTSCKRIRAREIVLYGDIQEPYTNMVCDILTVTSIHTIRALSILRNNIHRIEANSITVQDSLDDGIKIVSMNKKEFIDAYEKKKNKHDERLRTVSQSTSSAKRNIFSTFSDIFREHSMFDNISLLDDDEE